MKQESLAFRRERFKLKQLPHVSIVVSGEGEICEETAHNQKNAASMVQRLRGLMVAIEKYERCRVSSDIFSKRNLTDSKRDIYKNLEALSEAIPSFQDSEF